MEIKCFYRFLCLLNYSFDFAYCYIYSPTCQTVVSDPFLWYSGPDSIHFEEEPEEAAAELQRVDEWQADNVIQTLGQALRCETFWEDFVWVVLAFIGHYFLAMLI